MSICYQVHMSCRIIVFILIACLRNSAKVISRVLRVIDFIQIVIEDCFLLFFILVSKPQVFTNARHFKVTLVVDAGQWLAGVNSLHVPVLRVFGVVRVVLLPDGRVRGAGILLGLLDLDLNFLRARQHTACTDADDDADEYNPDQRGADDDGPLEPDRR